MAVIRGAGIATVLPRILIYIKDVEELAHLQVIRSRGSRSNRNSRRTSPPLGTDMEVSVSHPLPLLIAGRIGREIHAI